MDSNIKEHGINCACFCVFLSLAGQYTIDLSDDCGQLSQAEHRGHNPVIMTNLKKKRQRTHPYPLAY